MLSIILKFSAFSD